MQQNTPFSFWVVIKIITIWSSIMSLLYVCYLWKYLTKKTSLLILKLFKKIPLLDFSLSLSNDLALWQSTLQKSFKSCLILLSLRYWFFSLITNHCIWAFFYLQLKQSKYSSHKHSNNYEWMKIAAIITFCYFVTQIHRKIESYWGKKVWKLHIMQYLLI